MWEELKIYKQLDKKDINATFLKFGKELLSLLDDYALEQTSSIIKLYRHVNGLEQTVFVERGTGSYGMQVHTCIKPIDFYRKHKFTMVNVVPLGTILDNYRRSFYPLTKEWQELAIFLAAKIRNETNQYFEKYNSYEKIIARRAEIEPKGFGIDNKYELLIFAAIRTRNQPLLLSYIDQKLSRPHFKITKSEYLKPGSAIDDISLLHQIKKIAQQGDFESIEKTIAAVTK